VAAVKKSKNKMRISALSSGSSGNCFFIENEKCNSKKNAVLVDCGISCKQIEERLNSLHRNAENIKAVFITHEHTDHIKGIDVFARKFSVPVYVPKKIIGHKFLCSDENLINGIKNNETIKIAGMEINAFPKEHLSVDPVSYSIIDAHGKNKKASIITDAGHACSNIINNVSDSDFLCIESNHDIEMLNNGPYPWHLKKWIKSDNGHLSNMQAACCVLEHAPKKLKNIMLAHLSEHNNTSKLALSTFQYFIKQRSDLKPKINISEKVFASELMKV